MCADSISSAPRSGAISRVFQRFGGPHSALSRLLRCVGEVLIRCVYRVRIEAVAPLPSGGVLLLPNHLTWVDALMLQLACPRPIRFLVYEEIFYRPMLRPFFEAFGALPVSSKRASGAVKASVKALRAGEVVCLFPEGELSRTGILLRLKRGFEVIAREAQAPVVPVWLDQLWGSIFSFAEGRFFFKWPRKWRYPVTVAFGEAIDSAQAGMATVRERLLELGERCYQGRPVLERHLGREAIRGLRRHRREVMVVDGLDGSSLTGGELLSAAVALSEEIRRRCRGSRVGIVLPPSKGAVLVNVAVVLAGKVPVNLNFTASKPALLAAQRIAGLEHMVTGAAFREKLPDFPWSEHVWLLEEWVGAFRGRMVMWRIFIELLPSWLLGDLLELPKRGDHEEALVLFTSGSSGEPKGVVLSHRNLLGNVSQFAMMLGMGKGASVLACLPMFHSFGSTVTLWYPVLEGVRMVTYPSPMDAVKNAELIEAHQIDLLCSTPTFLRSYLRKIEARQLASLQLVVTGAERLPEELAKAFEERFGKAVMQGYGLTETSPVVSVNLPNPVRRTEAYSVQECHREGSVGRLAPGMAGQIRDPETGQVKSLHETGMLWLRGPNVFEGYLGDPERTGEVLVGGWFRTGDLARFDEDGFLFIEGRVSRFSKVGGEMVPHETVEQALRKVLGAEAEEKVVCVTGVPDEAKGEALVVLCTKAVEGASVRRALHEAGLPNLWIPKRYLQVGEIPHLATGKLDLRRMREMALGAS